MKQNISEKKTGRIEKQIWSDMAYLFKAPLA